jgi:hypothetical protein
MIFNPVKLLAKYYSSFISDEIGDTVIMFPKQYITTLISHTSFLAYWLYQ